MNHTTIINKLNELSYKGFKEAYMHQMEDQKGVFKNLCQPDIIKI